MQEPNSSKTHSFGIRLPNATYNEIERLVKTSPRLNLDKDSVGLYCQQCIERYVWRHSTRKYKKKY